MTLEDEVTLAVRIVAGVRNLHHPRVALSVAMCFVVFFSERDGDKFNAPEFRRRCLAGG